MARALDDTLVHLRFNEPELGILVFKSEGNPAPGPSPPTPFWKPIATIGSSAKSASS